MNLTTHDHKNRDTVSDMYREVCVGGVNLKFKIVTGSMTPLLAVGDMVEVTWTNPGRIRLGDIVAIIQGKDVIVHRILGLPLL